MGSSKTKCIKTTFYQNRHHNVPNLHISVIYKLEIHLMMAIHTNFEWWISIFLPKFISCIVFLFWRSPIYFGLFLFPPIFLPTNYPKYYGYNFSQKVYSYPDLRVSEDTDLLPASRPAFQKREYQNTTKRMFIKHFILY